MLQTAALYFCTKHITVKKSPAIFLWIIFLLVPFATFAQKETRKPGSFTELKIYGRFDVVLAQGAEESVSIESAETDMQNVLTEVEDGKLKVRMKTNYFKDTNVKVIVTFKQLNAIEASAGAVINAGTVEAKTFSFKVNSGSEVEAEVIADSLTTEVTQGASLTLAGNVKYHAAQVSTGGQLSAYLLHATSAKARVNMGGYAKIFVKEKLDAAVNMGGNISYKGEPKEVKQGTTMGGSVTQIRE